MDQRRGGRRRQRTQHPILTETERRALKNPHGYTLPQSSSLTISTRGIGLMVSRTTSVMRKQLPPHLDDIPVAQIYRAGLALLEAKMYPVRGMHSREDCSEFGYEYPYEFYEYFTLARKNVYNLSPVVMIIDSVGRVEINDKSFIPVFLRKQNALNIRLHNLREYCERMSNKETHWSERIEGYELNSIPNANWERLNPNDERSIILKNPNEIIPPDYNCNDIETVLNDVQETSFWCEKLHFYTEQFIARMNNANRGNPGMLVSTHVIPGQSVKVNNGIISRNQKEFWSSEPINNESWWVGALGLVGEVLNPFDGSSRSNFGGMRIMEDWDQMSRIALF